MRGKRLAITAGLTGFAMAGGIALAAWTASGTGQGFAKAINAQALTTLPEAAGMTTAQLYPGGSGDVLVKIFNPNPYPVEILSVTGSGPIVTTPTDAACDLSTGVTFHGYTPSPMGPFIVPPSGSSVLSIPSGATMSNASANECQGETFSIPVSISGQSAA